MSKITISAVLVVLRLSISFLAKVVRLIYTIIDLVDDGVVNQSAERPEWMQLLASAISNVEDIIGHFTSIEDELTLSK